MTELLPAFVRHAPGPLTRETPRDFVEPLEDKLTGFVFKIQANMDPGHRDRIAFMRICSGRYAKGMRLFHVRLGKEMRINDALTFLAADRQHTDEAYAGDILGLHNHGTINIGDTFTEGEKLKFTGIPNFAPEMFRRVVLRDPLQHEGAAEGARPAVRGGCHAGVPSAAQQRPDPRRRRPAAVRRGRIPPAGRVRRAGDVRQHQRVHRALGHGKENKKLEEFRAKAYDNLALDHAGALVYLAPTRVNLQLTLERWPDIEFRETREHLAAAA